MRPAEQQRYVLGWRPLPRMRQWYVSPEPSSLFARVVTTRQSRLRYWRLEISAIFPIARHEQASWRVGRLMLLRVRRKPRRITEQAATIAESQELVRRAEFGELQAAIELESSDVPRRLQALGSREALDPEEQVILADRTMGAETRFGLPVDLARGRAARQLLRFVADPMTRTSFRNVFGYTLAAMANFDEALELMAEQLDDAERYRLEFVVPYTLINKAIVGCGRHDYVGAEEFLDEADERALKAGDQTALNTAGAIRMRLYIAQAAFDLALSRPLTPRRDTTRSIRAELTACRALALAGTERFEQSRALAIEALESCGVEAGINSNAAQAIAAMRSDEHDQAVTHAHRSLSLAVRTGMVESFVCAYRGFPELIVLLLENKENHQELVHILTIAGDAVPLAARRVFGLATFHSEPVSTGEGSLIAARPGDVESRDRKGAVYQPRNRKGPRASHFREAGRQVSSGGGNAGGSARTVIKRCSPRAPSHVPPLHPLRRSQSPAFFRAGTHHLQ